MIKIHILELAIYALSSMKTPKKQGAKGKEVEIVKEIPVDSHWSILSLQIHKCRTR